MRRQQSPGGGGAGHEHKGGAAGLAVALAACTGEEPAGRAGGSTVAPVSPTTVAAVRPPPDPSGVFVRTRESSVYGDLGDGWRKQSVVVGLLAFVALRYAATQPAVDFRRRGGRYQGLKVLAVAKAGTTVTLTVPAAERRHLSLLYDPAAWKEDNRYRIADGDTAVTFRPARPGRPRSAPTAPSSTAASWSPGRAAPPSRCPPRSGGRRGG